MRKVRCEFYPRLIVPFTDAGEIDCQSAERLIERLAAGGADGVFVVCGADECFSLREEEKLTLAARCIERCHARGMKCIVAGPAQSSLLRKLDSMKPDAIALAVDGVTEGKDLRATLDALSPDTRLGVYACSKVQGQALSAHLVDEVKADGRFGFIIGVSGAEAAAAPEGSGIDLYCLGAASLLESLTAGAAGYCGPLFSLMPEMFALLREAMIGKNANPARARRVAGAISAASLIEGENFSAAARFLLKHGGVFASDQGRGGKRLGREEENRLLAWDGCVHEAYYRYFPRARVTYAFEEGAFFPECHASCVLPTKDGALAVYFAGSYEKHNDVGIWLSVKDKSGWQAPRRLAKVAEVPHWNPVIFPIAGGVRVVFKVGSEIPDWLSWHMESYDGGATWTRPRPYGAACGPVRSKPIVLSTGEILAPNSTESAAGWAPQVDISRDEGETFALGAPIALNRERPQDENYLAGAGAIQPTLWESAPGHVHALLRTTAGRVFRADSADGGRSFCTAYPTNMPNNNSGIDIVRAGGDLYLAMNPVAGNWADRTPLVILKSTDNGAHFTLFRVISDECLDDGHDRAAELSYPSIAYDGEALHITFTCMRRTIGYARIALKE